MHRIYVFGIQSWHSGRRIFIYIIYIEKNPEESHDFNAQRERKRARILTCIIAALLALAFCIFSLSGKNALYASADGTSYIKWVDFGVTADAMTEAMKLDIASYGTDSHVSWIDLLAYLGAKYGGNFKNYKNSDLLYAAEALKQNPTCFEEMKYFSYYKEAYGAVLDGYLGTYAVYDNTDGRYEYTEKYGLKVFSPIARGYSYSDYDDFGASRSYGTADGTRT